MEGAWELNVDEQREEERGEIGVQEWRSGIRKKDGIEGIKGGGKGGE